MISKSDISAIRSLADKKARDEQRLFVVEGRKTVEEALRSGFRVRRLIGTEEYAAMPGLEVASEKDISRMSALRTPQGVLAAVEIPDREPPCDIAGRLVLALDGVQDPGNLGTIMRTADWFGIGDIFCTPGSADCYNPKVVQATMGAVFRVGVHYVEPEFIESLALRSGVEVFGAFMDGEQLYGAGLAGTASAMVVLGSEGRGISPHMERIVTRRICIPRFPADRELPESLNVAAAAAVICSEFRRR